VKPSPTGAFSSKAMIVIITASTPSLNASRRPVSDFPELSGERPNPAITPLLLGSPRYGFGAGGGGVSGVFSRPAYQFGVSKDTGKMRGTPDISMSAAVNGGAWVYFTFVRPGWHIIGGTSEASPIFSGIVALADQVAGHRLGLINPGLYLLGALGHLGDRQTGLVDVTSGNNSFGGVTGFTADPGYDLASGWGTIDAAKFVPALAKIG